MILCKYSRHFTKDTNFISIPELADNRVSEEHAALDTSVSFRLSARQLMHKSILSVIAIYAIVAV